MNKNRSKLGIKIKEICNWTPHLYFRSPPKPEIQILGPLVMEDNFIQIQVSVRTWGWILIETNTNRQSNFFLDFFWIWDLLKLKFLDARFFKFKFTKHWPRYISFQFFIGNQDFKFYSPSAANLKVKIFNLFGSKESLYTPKINLKQRIVCDGSQDIKKLENKLNYLFTNKFLDFEKTKINNNYSSIKFTFFKSIFLLKSFKKLNKFNLSSEKKVLDQNVKNIMLGYDENVTNKKINIPSIKIKLPTSNSFIKGVYES